MPSLVFSTTCRCTASETRAPSAAPIPVSAVTPDHGSARWSPYSAPIPSQAATSARNASVSRWPDGVRSYASQPYIRWLTWPTFSVSVIRDSRSRTRSATGASGSRNKGSDIGRLLKGVGRSAQFEDAHAERGEGHVPHRAPAGQLTQLPVR